MNLFFDHNLSPRLIKLVSDLYPGSVHVRDVALHAADDQVV
jgi:predicted nuclease of predicted toxin-antitoxin system